MGVLQLGEDLPSLSQLLERFRRCQDPIEDGTRYLGSVLGDIIEATTDGLDDVEVVFSSLPEG